MKKLKKIWRQIPKKYKDKCIYIDTNIILNYILSGNDGKILANNLGGDIKIYKDQINSILKWIEFIKDENIKLKFCISVFSLGELFIIFYNKYDLFNSFKNNKYNYNIILRILARKLFDKNIFNIKSFDKKNFDSFINLLLILNRNKYRSEYSDRIILAHAAADENSFGFISMDQNLIRDATNILKDIRKLRSNNQYKLKFYISDNLEDILNKII